MVRGLVATCLALAALSCRNQSPTRPDGVSCFLGPLELPTAVSATVDDPATQQGSAGSGASTAPTLCFTGRAGCPSPRPANARTLVGLATCVDSDITTSRCTPKVDTCPRIDPNGNQPLRFLLARPGDACSAVVDVLLQASGDGGAGLEWRVQDYVASGASCVAKGGPRVGLASMPGSCCATTLEIPVPERNKVFRLIARTDWLTP